MIDIALFLAAPLAACLGLVGILGYFGLHVLRRGVIFVDLALGQIAALGALVAFVLGYEPGSPMAFGFSLAAASVGAAVFAVSRVRGSKVPQEAIIGITYVVASAASIVVADRAPEGAEHIKELLAGSVLWVSWTHVLRDLLVCLFVGCLHYLLRRRFILISEDPEAAFERGIRVHWWDFLFYLSFGVVITLAVEVAGVLMVFSYLVGPSIIAIAACASWKARLAVAWAVGSLASVVGLLASYRWDLPSGPAVVCMLGVFLLAFQVFRWSTRRRTVGLAIEASEG